MAFPKKRKRERMGCRDERPRYWKHMRHVRSTFACAVPNCRTGTKIVFHHVRRAGNAGMGQKDDRYGVALCQEHHDQGHQIGWPTFEGQYGVDLVKQSEWFERNSPHREWLEDENAV